MLTISLRLSLFFKTVINHRHPPLLPVRDIQSVRKSVVLTFRRDYGASKLFPALFFVWMLYSLTGLSSLDHSLLSSLGHTKPRLRGFPIAQGSARRIADWVPRGHEAMSVSRQSAPVALPKPRQGVHPLIVSSFNQPEFLVRLKL